MQHLPEEAVVTGLLIERSGFGLEGSSTSRSRFNDGCSAKILAGGASPGGEMRDESEESNDVCGTTGTERGVVSDTDPEVAPVITTI